MTPTHRLKLAAQAVIDAMCMPIHKYYDRAGLLELRDALAAMPVSEDMTQAEIDEMVGKPGAMAGEGLASGMFVGVASLDQFPITGWGIYSRDGYLEAIIKDRNRADWFVQMTPPPPAGKE